MFNTICGGRRLRKKIVIWSQHNFRNNLVDSWIFKPFLKFFNWIFQLYEICPVQYMNEPPHYYKWLLVWAHPTASLANLLILRGWISMSLEYLMTSTTIRFLILIASILSISGLRIISSSQESQKLNEPITATNSRTSQKYPNFIYWRNLPIFDT